MHPLHVDRLIDSSFEHEYNAAFTIYVTESTNLAKVLAPAPS